MCEMHRQVPEMQEVCRWSVPQSCQMFGVLDTALINSVDYVGQAKKQHFVCLVSYQNLVFYSIAVFNNFDFVTAINAVIT